MNKKGKPIPDDLRRFEIFTYFNLFFDVGKAKSMLKDYGYENKKAKLSLGLPMVRTDDKFYMKTDLDIPIIFAYVELKEAKGYILIDGYHRLRKATELNKFVKCVFLGEEDSKQVRISHDEAIILQMRAKRIEEGLYVCDEEK